MGDEISLGSLVAKTDPKQLDAFLSTVSKYEKVLDKAVGIIEKLNKMGVLPAAIRAIGVKQGIPDIDKPLTNPLALDASTASHRLLYVTLNGLSEEEVIGMIKQITITEKKDEKPIK